MFILETVYEKEKKNPSKYLSELVFVTRILPLYIYIHSVDKSKSSTSKQITSDHEIVSNVTNKTINNEGQGQADLLSNLYLLTDYK